MGILRVWMSGQSRIARTRQSSRLHLYQHHYQLASDCQLAPAVADELRGIGLRRELSEVRAIGDFDTSNPRFDENPIWVKMGVSAH